MRVSVDQSILVDRTTESLRGKQTEEMSRLKQTEDPGQLGEMQDAWLALGLEKGHE